MRVGPRQDRGVRACSSCVALEFNLVGSENYEVRRTRTLLGYSLGKALEAKRLEVPEVSRVDYYKRTS